MIKEIPKTLKEIIKNDYENIAGIVIYKRNQLIYEDYFQGYKSNDTIHIASVTKSILSIIVGIAIDQGLIKNLEQKVIDFFPNYIVKQREKIRQQVTLEHLLTMTAPYKFKSEPYTKVYSSEDWTIAALDLLGGKKLSREFKYTTIGLQVLSGVIIKATKKSVIDYAIANLFEPLGITIPKNLQIKSKEEYLGFLKDKYVNGWVVDPKGVNTPGWGLTLTTRDMAKIGLLYANNGKWEGRQIVSLEWIQQSTKTHSQWNKLSYGYLWWIIDGGINCFAAIGDGGNIIYVNTDLDVVIAITSRFKPRVNNRIKFIENYLLPLLK